jgi:hypothetical protein
VDVGIDSCRTVAIQFAIENGFCLCVEGEGRVVKSIIAEFFEVGGLRAYKSIDLSF